MSASRAATFGIDLIRSLVDLCLHVVHLGLLMPPSAIPHPCRWLERYRRNLPPSRGWRRGVTASRGVHVLLTAAGTVLYFPKQLINHKGKCRHELDHLDG